MPVCGCSWSSLTTQDGRRGWGETEGTSKTKSGEMAEWELGNMRGRKRVPDTGSRVNKSPLWRNTTRNCGPAPSASSRLLDRGVPRRSEQTLCLVFCPLTFMSFYSRHTPKRIEYPPGFLQNVPCTTLVPAKNLFRHQFLILDLLIFVR